MRHRPRVTFEGVRLTAAVVGAAMSRKNRFGDLLRET
jgi:hypothetical protein